MDSNLLKQFVKYAMPSEFIHFQGAIIENRKVKLCFNTKCGLCDLSKFPEIDIVVVEVNTSDIDEFNSKWHNYKLGKLKQSEELPNLLLHKR